MQTVMKSWLRRYVRRTGRAVYWRLPARQRDALVGFAFRRAGWMFRGFPRYELWRQQGRVALTPQVFISRRLIALENVAPISAQPGSVAVHAHVFYEDVAEEFSRYLAEMPFRFDLLVTVVSEAGETEVRRAFSKLSAVDQLIVERVPNRGRDIAPMLVTFGQRLAEYDFIAHIHTKKSEYNAGATEGWRDYLCKSLFGGQERIRRIFGLLVHEDGLVFPQTYARVPYVASTWLANRASGHALCARIGIADIPSGYFDFPVGSMFWARGATLRPLLTVGLTLDDFEPETAQTDGTLAHAVERVLGVVARHSGHSIAILRDDGLPSWSPWRFEQFTGRDQAYYVATFTAPDVELVIFDIFDTLLVRPLVDTETVKRIVARRLDPHEGECYLADRHAAEAAARARAGRDIDLHAVGRELASMSGLSGDSVARIIAIEAEVERALVSLRPGATDLLRIAEAGGKRVVFASDMFLPLNTIEHMMRDCGIDATGRIYLSSDIGVRKDTGQLYDHLLRVEGVPPGRALMVGDNERSDFQIPCDMGLRTLHVLRAVELARGHERFAGLIDATERDVRPEAQLSIGLIVRRCFSDLLPDRFSPEDLLASAAPTAIGYGVCGPLVLSFAQWLRKRTIEDGVEHLYFLAREGQFLRQVYEMIAARQDSPPSSYLVVSRRAVNVPATQGMEEIVDISSSYFGPGSLEEFLFERFGLDPDPARILRLTDAGLWKPGRKLTIRDQEIGHVLPVLEALLPEILEQSARERPALMAYLAGQGMLPGGASCAVVDIGYSGTIQHRLARLLGGGIHGYYVATDCRIARVREAWDVRAEGFLHDLAECAPLGPTFIRHSFVAEKFLSSDDPQVIRYRLDEDGGIEGEYRPLSAVERSAKEARRMLRQGALEYVRDAMDIRARVLPDFDVPSDVVLRLFEAMVAAPSPAETNCFRDIALDDHYCGRGVVT